MSQDFMRDEIEEIPDLFINVQEKLTKFNEINKLDNVDEFWFAGSGDSHCASLYASSIFNQLTIPARSFVSMEISKFFHFSERIKPCLVAISVSGKTPRILEAVQKFKEFYPSQPIIGLTDNPHSSLYKESTIKILIGASPAETLVYDDKDNSIVKEYDGYQNPIPQTKTYFFNILWITFLAYALKEDIKTFNKVISSFNNNFKDWMIESEQWVSSHPLTYPEKTIFIGSNLFRSLAQFGAYKWFEFTYPGLDQEIEEYAHTHYFTTESNTDLLFFSPTATHFTRIKELLDGALIDLIKPEIFLFLNGSISGEDQVKYSDLNSLEIPYESNSGNELTAEIESYFYLMIPLFWIMYHTARKQGFDTNRFRGGKEVEKYIKGSLSTIRESKIKTS
ncbi:MAG: SIS domain-containing protein [Candidatus Hodarchaeales archaeon]|jgi:glucosamine 6-phosphate synthetase-like amidotransferase/phosphosugar isomerase protein